MFMNNLMPKTVSAKDIQKNYRKIFDEAKSTKEPVVVLTNNTPDVAIVDVGELNKLYNKAQRAEVVDALQVMRVYKKEKRQKKLKELKTLKDLV